MKIETAILEMLGHRTNGRTWRLK